MNEDYIPLYSQVLAGAI